MCKLHFKSFRFFCRSCKSCCIIFTFFTNFSKSAISLQHHFFFFAAAPKLSQFSSSKQTAKEPSKECLVSNLINMLLCGKTFVMFFCALGNIILFSCVFVYFLLLFKIKKKCIHKLINNLLIPAEHKVVVSPFKGSKEQQGTV